MIYTNKAQFGETDIVSKFIMPAIIEAGWDSLTQIREQVPLRDGKVMVRGQMAVREPAKFPDIVLYHKPNLPLAVIEAKKNKFEVGNGMQQALDYAELLDVPFVFSSNGDGFIFHDKTFDESKGECLETEISLEDFPTPDQLWDKYCHFKNYTPAQLPIITQDYHDDGSGKTPRYYQLKAINKTIEAISRDQQRVLLVMATGTGKTYTAFQIIWRLWKSGQKKRILFLADRNILVDQSRINDFQPFGNAMTKIENRTVDPAFEIHLGLYQALTGIDESQKAFKQVAPDFFDLVVIDECHRGSAAEDSAWREILDYFSSATHIGLTATPKETEEVSNSSYFGEPIYTYSLKQGIGDGFLAPYKVIRVDMDVDLQGWRPTDGQKDKHGHVIDDRIYNQKDFDRRLIIDERTELVAQTISSYLQSTDPMAKTIVFCDDINHADRMRRALINCNPQQVKQNDKYIMKITGDDKLGKAQLDNFINPKKAYPVIVTTSELMSTGVDAQTCKLIVLDQNIQSMTKFKQIIGRGTRINEKYHKLWFTIMDFKKATELFSDKDFDGNPERVMVVTPTEITEEGEALDEVINGEADIDLDFTNTGEGYTAPVGEDEIKDPITGGLSPTPIDKENTEQIDTGGGVSEPRKKYFVAGVPFQVIAKRVQYYGADGKLTTESFQDYTRKTFHKQYASLDAFTKRWREAERKQTVIDELASVGIIWEALQAEIGQDMDPFDLICHVVYDQPPLTRRERANEVKKRDYFTRYSESAQKVLNVLLDKYADEGVKEIESLNVLKLQPLNAMGSPMEIVKQSFGDKEGYKKAISDLEAEIYWLPPQQA